MSSPLRLATRGSRQALGQAQAVADAIEAATGTAVEFVLIETTGASTSRCTPSVAKACS